MKGAATMRSGATLWDRASGGTTMVLHCTGTTVPGAPLQPEYLKAHIYLPPAFVTQNQQLHEPIMNLVQQFTETIGLKTTIDWSTHAHKSFGYNLTQTGVVHANSSMDLFPTPEANTSYYVFLGQPVSLFSSDASPFSSDAASPASLYDIRNELGPETYEILNLQEIIHILRAEKSSLAEELDIVRSTVSHLEHQMLYYSSAAASSMDKTPSWRLKPTAVSHLTPTRDPTRDYRVVSPSGSPSHCLPAVCPSPSTPATPSRPSRMTSSHVTHSPGISVHRGRYPSQHEPTETVKVARSMLDLVIDTHNLGNHRNSILVVARLATPSTYVEELTSLGIEADSAIELAKA
ncbi:hypothetical protein CVT25_005345, partial [Psilocybe cyanescens]